MPPKKLSPRQKTVMQHLREGFQNTDAKNALDLLEKEAHEAVLETLAGYLAAPDTLRALVKDEFLRHVRYTTFEKYQGELKEAKITKDVLDLAAKSAAEATKSPEYQEALLQRMKSEYLKEYEEHIKRYVGEQAWRDANAAYQAAFRPSRTRTK